MLYHFFWLSLVLMRNPLSLELYSPKSKVSFLFYLLFRFFFLSLVFRNVTMMFLGVGFFKFILAFAQLLESVRLSFARFGKFSTIILLNNSCSHTLFRFFFWDSSYTNLRTFVILPLVLAALFILLSIFLSFCFQVHWFFLFYFLHSCIGFIREFFCFVFFYQPLHFVEMIISLMKWFFFHLFQEFCTYS